jgi:heme o synthase
LQQGDQSSSLNNEQAKLENPLRVFKLDKKNSKKMADLLELTKFKLSALNTVGAFTMFYFHAPLLGVGLTNSALFLFAT